MKQIAQTGTTIDLAIQEALKQLKTTREHVEIEVIEQGRKGFLGFGAKEAKVLVTKKETSPIVQEEVKSPVGLEQVTVFEKDLEEEKEEYEELTVPEVEEEEKKENPRVDGFTPSSLEKVIPNREQEDVLIENSAKDYIVNIANELNCSNVDITVDGVGKYVDIQIDTPDAAKLIGKRGQNLNALQQLTQLIVNQQSTRFKVVRMNVGDYRERREQSLIYLANRMADQAVSKQRKVKLEPMPSYERKIVHHTLAARIDVDTYSEGSDPYRYLVIEPLQ